MLTCLSGASLVFEQEITEGLHPGRFYVKEVKQHPLPLNELLESVSSTLPDSVSITSVSLSSNPKRTYQVSLSQPRRSSIYVNPYTGEITGKNQREAFFAFMFRLHRWLLGSGASAGKLIVGISTLAFVFILVSGLIIWWPQTRKAWKNRFRIHFYKGRPRLWHDLHVSGGIYALLFLLAMALTGLNFSFPWYRTGFYKLFGVEAKQRGGHEQHGNPSHENTRERQGKNHTDRGQEISRKKAIRGERPTEKSSHQEEENSIQPERTFACWQQVYEQLAREYTNYREITVSKASATVSTSYLGNQRAGDSFRFNPHTGKITERRLYKDGNASDKLFGWIYSIHVGSWGGWITRILAFIAALLGATLPVTGYYLWIKHLARKSSHPSSARH